MMPKQYKLTLSEAQAKVVAKADEHLEGGQAMSVIVMGMEMTGKCESCLLRYRYQGAYCTDHCYATPRRKNIDPWTFGRARNGDRPEWCPLRPLPEKHGDLVDISQEVNIEYFDDMNQEWSWKAGTVADALVVCEEFPMTIVEAEGE